ncbi:MFS transporter [Pseudonocardia oroxyli]|uniref:Drug resistance transporter, EmrB/QacA subfamily n=1 Tax=Pseudonocardia oroxyli TaxID=366584 RepID=A0A1G8C8T5_PSEOR|nr:MFS transporter [Pseudonocardia oroxyli]SDH41719.1 drug resistance transporter, EmrB/QacA subfamily [Pseudonocardia oroxyli]
MLGITTRLDEGTPVSAAASRPVPRPGLTLALLASAQFMTAIDFDIVFVALPEIGRDLGFSEQSLQTVVSAYTVVLGGFLLLGGRAADRLGARRMFVTGLAVFGLSSLVAGLAEGPTVLVLARAAQGLGAALLTPSTLKLVTAHFEEGPARTKALAIWGAAGATGAAVGALGGGVLTSLLGWEWVFFVNVPLMAVALAATPLLLGRDQAVGTGGFDLPGAVLATAGFTLVVLGLVSGPDIGWLTARGLGAAVLGVLLVGVFVVVESRTRDPLVPLRLFRNRNVVAATVVIFVFMGTVGTQYYLFTTYLQTVLAYTPLAAGFAFLPLSACSMLASMTLVPLLLGRLGIRTTLVLGMSGVAASLVVLSLGMSVGGSYWAALPGVLLWGASAGLAFPPLFVSVSTGVAPEQQGVASALASTSQYLGSAVGLAALVAVASAGSGPDATPEAVVAGLRLAGWVAAAVTLVGVGLAAVILRPARAGAAQPVQSV